MEQPKPFTIGDTTVNTSVFNVIERDTLALHFPKRDPFLGRRIKVVKNNNTSIKTIKPRVLKQKSSANWPSIDYLGFIKSRKNTEILGLLKIDGILFKVRKNMVVKGVKILQVEKSTVTLMFNNEKRNVIKK